MWVLSTAGHFWHICRFRCRQSNTPGAFCLHAHVCDCFPACQCVCAIHSWLLMFWRSTVRLSRGIAFRLRHSSETFLAFYSLIKTAGLPWVLCVSGTLLPLPVPRWTKRTCVCMSLLNPGQQSQDYFMIAHHESMTRITDIHLRAGGG